MHLVSVSRAPMTPGNLEIMEIKVYEPVGPDLFLKNQTAYISGLRLVESKTWRDTEGPHIANCRNRGVEIGNNRSYIREASAVRLPLAVVFV